MPIQQCSSCQKKKSDEDFAPSMRRSGGWCRLCVSSRKKAIRHGDVAERDYDNCQWEPCSASLEGKRRHAKFCSTAHSMKHWHANNPEQRRLYWLKAVYGLTPEQYDEMIIKQSGLCAICGEQMPEYRDEQVDHDHNTGAVRGLLCNDCNNGLGRFEDDVSRLQAAVEYLLRPC